VAKAAYARQELTERLRGVRVGDLMARDCSLVDSNSTLHMFVYNHLLHEGYVAQVNRSVRVSGRAEMSFEFDRIRLRDGRASNFAGYLESVRTTSCETVKVDN
jgi:hypothetical protein